MNRILYLLSITNHNTNNTNPYNTIQIHTNNTNPYKQYKSIQHNTNTYKQYKSLTHNTNPESFDYYHQLASLENNTSNDFCYSVVFLRRLHNLSIGIVIICPGS